MSRWNNLTMSQKSEIIGMAVRNGITGLEEIRNMYEEGGPVNFVRKRLYDNVIPFGYNQPVERVYNAVIKNKKEQYDPNYGVSEDAAETLDALWGTYLNIPENKRHPIYEENGITRSAGPDNKTYYQLKNLDPVIDEIVSEGLGYQERYKKNSLSGWNYIYKPPLKQGQTSTINQNQILGDYQVSRGYDERGDYLSYSDVWDINPFQKTANLYGQDNTENESLIQKVVRNFAPKVGDASFGIGTPVNIYGKVYLDDIYGVPEPTHSTYLPEITVWGKDKRKHGDGGTIDRGYLYQKGGGLKGGKRAGDKAGTDQCAAWSNGLLRDNGYLISGNAWGLNHADMLFNGYEGLDKPSIYDRSKVEVYNHNAAGNVYNNFDSKTLDKSKPYVVNMYYNGSPAQEEAYKNGKNVTGTHTGILTHDGNQWVVTHNIHNTIHEEPFISLQRGDNKYGVTAIYKPRKDNVFNKLRGFLGFSDGGFLN